MSEMVPFQLNFDLEYANIALELNYTWSKLSFKVSLKVQNYPNVIPQITYQLFMSTTILFDWYRSKTSRQISSHFKMASFVTLLNASFDD